MCYIKVKSQIKFQVINTIDKIRSTLLNPGTDEFQNLYPRTPSPEDYENFILFVAAINDPKADVVLYTLAIKGTKFGWREGPLYADDSFTLGIELHINPGFLADKV